MQKFIGNAIIIINVISWLCLFLLTCFDDTRYTGSFESLIIGTAVIVAFWAICQIITACFFSYKKSCSEAEQAEEPFIEEVELEKNYSSDFQIIYNQLLLKKVNELIKK